MWLHPQDWLDYIFSRSHTIEYVRIHFCPRASSTVCCSLTSIILTVFQQAWLWYGNDTAWMIQWFWWFFPHFPNLLFHWHIFWYDNWYSCSGSFVFVYSTNIVFFFHSLTFLRLCTPNLGGYNFLSGFIPLSDLFLVPFMLFRLLYNVHLCLHCPAITL